MIGVRITACTLNGEEAIRRYVDDCLKGTAGRVIGLSRSQMFIGRRASKLIPYSEEYFVNPMMLVVTLKKSFMSQGHNLIPSIELMLKNVMSKYLACPDDYTIEVF
jgi:hypothetical protein